MKRSQQTARVRLGTYGSPFFPQTLSLLPPELKTHIHVVGTTGSGKSRFLAGFYLELLKAGFSATLLDPHGDLARDILKLLIQEGMYQDPHVYNRIVYLDLPAAEQRNLCLPFNVLKQPQPPHVIATNVMDALHRYWPSLEGGRAPRFDKLVRYGVNVLVSAGYSLPSLSKFLMDAAFRNQLLAFESDQDVVSFWAEWYGQLGRQPRLLLDYVDSTLSRVDLLTHDPFLKTSLAAPEFGVDLRSLMDSNRSLIVNLKLQNRETGRLLGCLLTVLVEQAALARRAPGTVHYLILDEFASFIDRSPKALNSMLSQTRKMGLFAVLAHQNWSQTPPSLKGALQNCHLKVAFAADYDDALITSRILGRVEPKAVREMVDETTSEAVGMPEQWQTLIQELQDLPTGRAFIRRKLSPVSFPWNLVMKRPTSRLYKVKTLPVPDPIVPPKLLQEAEEQYLATYFRPKSDIAQHSTQRTAPMRRWETVREED